MVCFLHEWDGVTHSVMNKLPYFKYIGTLIFREFCHMSQIIKKKSISQYTRVEFMKNGNGSRMIMSLTRGLTITNPNSDPHLLAHHLTTLCI